MFKSKSKSALRTKTTILDYSHDLIWSCEASLLESIKQKKVGEKHGKQREREIISNK
jgi:hypothetical protein